MIIIERRVPVDFNYFLISCTHFGSQLHYKRGFDQFIEAVTDSYEGLNPDRNLVCHHGDAIEAITIDDKRYVQALADYVKGDDGTPFDYQVDVVVDKFRPIRKQIVSWMMGNHELKHRRLGNITKNHICKQLGVPYGTYACRIIFNDHKGELMFKHFATHGRKGISSYADDPIRQESNMQLTLKRQLQKKAGDCLLMSKGHTHRLIVAHPREQLYLVDDGTEITQQYTHSHRRRKY